MIDDVLALYSSGPVTLVYERCMSVSIPSSRSQIKLLTLLTEVSPDRTPSIARVAMDIE